MAHKEKLPSLPWELIEEILSRVPPQSLVHFKTVSKQFNTLLNNKTFIKNHKDTFRFIVSTDSKMYSISINPKIEVRELTLDTDPGLGSKIPYELVDGNELMLCSMEKETLIWNPWLRQTRWFKSDVDQSWLTLYGLGYNNDDDKKRVYKILASYDKESNPNMTSLKIGGFDSNVWNELESYTTTDQGGENTDYLHSRSVSLDGSLYWVAYYTNNSAFYVDLFDFSTQKFYKYCDLPCENNHEYDALVLGVFMEDRLSLLKQCNLSKKIEIWVTKNKIHKSYGKDVEWINFMEVSTPNLPYLWLDHQSPLSYFIEDKRLVVCSTDETRRIWIYVFEDKKLISKSKLDLVVDFWPLHCTYFPSLVSVPQVQKEEMNLDV